ncbi:hypothetical protein C5142_15680 [Rhodococcus sp. BGS-1C]|nr:hypothetical protein [Rhodococcus sp. KRD197]
MNTTVKLVGFAAAIALVFFAAYLIGSAVGPIGDQAPADHAPTYHEMSGA